MRVDSLEADRKKTKGLILQFAIVTFLVPTLAFVFIWGYAEFSDLDFRRSDWKRAILCIWLGTLLVLFREALRYIRSGKRQQVRGNYLYEQQSSNDYSSSTQIRRWESKKSRRMVNEIWMAAIIVPVLSVSLILVTAFWLGMELERSHWKTIALIVWLGTIVGLIRAAGRMRRANVMYSGSHGHLSL